MIRVTLRRSGAMIALVLAACGARGEPAPGSLPEADQGPPQMADTLVLSLPGGAAVWLAEGRRARDSAGTPCVERSVEIRRDSVKLKVPLLFTGSIPTMLDDTTIRAELFSNCRPSGVYKVGVRDGLPHRMNP
ncbi:MAG TPA: hypothetical protein VFU23_05275 [Gemmatimonadales bacterium]|nr:hypothetical protein [Gemmatimonadales bacterium]